MAKGIISKRKEVKGKISKEKGPTGIERNLTSYADEEFSKYMRRAFLSSAGYDKEDLSRPVVGIVDTTSDYNTCHRQMPEMVNAVKRGVHQAGGLPLAFPTISLNEILTSPTTMLYRNLLAMETEEMITAQPMDSVVLLGGCDKTVPAQIMAATSANIPAVSVVAGPMMTGYWRGERLGACTDCRRMWTKYRAGEIDDDEIDEIESSLVFTGGTCMVMGTASTMASIVETLGLMLPEGAAAPHATGVRLKNCVASGRLAVEMFKRVDDKKTRPKDILTRGSFLNAVTVLMALSGSTNAVIHLLAMARRAGIELTLNDFDEIGRKVPVLVDCKPAGSGYMEDFYHAGGVPTLLKALGSLIDLSQMTINGKNLGDVIKNTPPPGKWQNTIRTLEDPLYEVRQNRVGAISVITGSLAPDGAVIKTAAADPKLLQHRGPAVVFDSPEDAQKRIDDPSLKITPDHVMVLKNAGPVGALGMPEAGSLLIPKYLLESGVKDMVRVSDGRMSGTSYGAVVLHVSPEAAVGGPIGLIEDGDIIEIDVEKRSIDIVVDDDELAKRREEFIPPDVPKRGWKRLFVQSVLQAHLGCDLDFL